MTDPAALKPRKIALVLVMADATFPVVGPGRRFMSPARPRPGCCLRVWHFQMALVAGHEFPGIFFLELTLITVALQAILRLPIMIKLDESLPMLGRQTPASRMRVIVTIIAANRATTPLKLAAMTGLAARGILQVSGTMSFGDVTREVWKFLEY